MKMVEKIGFAKPQKTCLEAKHLPAWKNNHCLGGVIIYFTVNLDLSNTEAPAELIKKIVTAQYRVRTGFCVTSPGKGFESLLYSTAFHVFW